MRETVVKVAQGGALITRASAENVGRLNYVEKTNWRRVDDAEVVREGNVLFRPNSGLSQGTQALAVGSDVVGIWECLRPNGERVVVAATRTSIYRYNYSSGDWTTVGASFSSDAKYWEGESLDGYLILNNGVNLPVTLRAEENTVQPIYEMREAGIASVGTIAVYNGFLMCGDVTEINSDEMADWMTGGTPYGIPPSNICNRIRYQIAWSDFGKPRQWAPNVPGTIESATKNKILLDYHSSALVQIGAKLAIVGAGAGGGVLGGQTGFDDGMTVVAISGNEITINGNANGSLTYPLRVEVLRFTDTSSFVGRSSIQDDSSAVIRMKPLQTALVVYRETGIFIGRYTGVYELPFAFRPAHATRNVPFYPKTLIDLNGDSHLYATENSFYEFDGAGEPRLFAPLDDASAPFFKDLTPALAEKAFACHNPITRELWFNSVNGVLAFDYATKTTSWIDEAYGAHAYVRKPDGTTSIGPGEYWFVHAKAGTLLRYGLLDSGVSVFTRNNMVYWASLKWGLNSLGTESEEKDLLAYIPLLASSSVRCQLEVSLLGTDNPSRPPLPLAGTPVRIIDPRTNNQIDTFFRNIYFQDRIRVMVTANSPLKLSGRIFHYENVRTEGATRR